jgi:hypothetical protein
MILVLERRKGHSAYPFSSFSLLFLLAVDSINELVGVNDTPASRRSRFTVPIADLSALSVDVMVSAFKSYSALSAFVGYSDTPINL